MKSAKARPHSLTKLRLHLLGAFEASHSSGGEILLGNRKEQALLAYLAINAGHQQPRSKLADMFWGQYDERAARHSLRQALTSLRKARIDHSIMTADRNMVMIRSGAAEVDVAQFYRLATNGHLASLENAVQLYSGELLDGFVIDEERFEEWLSEERHKARNNATRAFLALIEAYDRDGRAHKAIDCARQLLRINPYDEDTLITAMNLLVRSGRELEALRIYQEFSNLLHHELGIEPKSETTEVYLRIADGRLPAGTTIEKQTEKTKINLLDAFRSLDGFVVWDEADRFVICNDKFRDIFAPAADILKPGVSWDAIMRVCMARGRFPLAQTAPEKYLQTRAKRRRSGNAEAPDTLLDDGRCYRLTHRRTENGGLIVVFTESSDRQKREIALHRSHLRFQAYLDALTVGIEEVDLDGRITFCNPVFSHCLGYETGELIGKLQSDIMQTPWVEVAKKQMTPKKAVLRRSQQSRRVSAQYFTRSGSYFAATVDWSVIRDENGQASGYVGIVMPA